MPQDAVLARESEFAALSRERKELLGKLTAAGGSDFAPLLAISWDLADIIEEIQDVSSKREEKLHAAFETKVKYSGKIRRKAKELGRFEQNIVREYDLKRISLQNGRKLASIIKLLKSNKAENARREAEEFYSLLETSERLKIAEDGLAKASAQVERAKRNVSAQLSGLEWLSAQPGPDREKLARHGERAKLRAGLGKIRLECIRSLQSLPLPKLLAKAKEQGLYADGFPAIHEKDAESLAAFLQKSGLGEKTAAELDAMAGESEQKLRHFGIGLAEFRHEVGRRKHFFGQIMALQAGSFLSPDDGKSIARLSQMSQEAKRAAERLSELEKAGEDDKAEWERMELVGAKRKELAGAGKEELEREMRGLEGLERAIRGEGGAEKPGKGNPAGDKEAGAGSESGQGSRNRAAGPEKGKKAGMLDSLLGIFRGK